MAFGVLDDLGAKGRAAAALGIYTDTSALLHGATPLDFRMFEKLTRDDLTKQVLDELRDYRVPLEWNAYRSTAFLNVMSVGGVRIAPVGFVRAEHRDVVAELANDLMRIEGTSIGIVIGFTEKGTEVSVRADSRLLGSDQPRIVRVIDHLLRTAFSGMSGFKYERRPPHHVEGGASRAAHRQGEVTVRRRLGARARRNLPQPLPRVRGGADRRPQAAEGNPPRRDPGADLVLEQVLEAQQVELRDGRDRLEALVGELRAAFAQKPRLQAVHDRQQHGDVGDRVLHLLLR